MKKHILRLLLICQLNLAYAVLIKLPRNIRYSLPKGPDISFLIDNDARKDDYPILSIETFRAYADFVLDESIWTIETDDLFDGCVIFVGLRQLRDFYFKVLPKINNRVIVISMGDQPFTSMNWDQYYKSSQYLTRGITTYPKVIAFFSKNIKFNHPKCVGLPLGKDFWRPETTQYFINSFGDLSKDTYFEKKINHVYLNFKITYESRVAIKNHWSLQDGVVHEESKEFEAYFTDLKNSRFVLSPRGYGLDCYRTWEALYAGSIPVIESSEIDYLYKDLPVIIVKDLTKITVADLDKEFEKMRLKDYKLEKLHVDYWLNKIENFKSVL